jgi:hypothetical protein
MFGKAIFLLDKLYRVNHHFREDIFDDPSGWASKCHPGYPSSLDQAKTSRGAFGPIASRNASPRLDRGGCNKAEELQDRALLGKRS